MFRLYFLITLNIYKNYLRAVSDDAKDFYSSILWLETYALIHLFLKKLLRLYAVGFCNQGVFYFLRVDELKKFAVNIFLSWCVSHILRSMHWLVSHILGAVHWKWEIVTTDQVQLCIGVIKGSIVCWYKVLRFLYL